MQLRENALTLLASVNVDFNAIAITTIYVVPAGNSCIITQLILKSPTGTTATAVASAGFNSPTYDDITDFSGGPVVIPDSGHWIGFTFSDYSTAGFGVLGTEGQSLKISVTTPEGVASTVDIDVFGYLF